MAEPRSGSDYNEAARYAFKNILTEGFLRMLVPDAFRRWRWDDWVDSQVVSYPGEAERRCDTVARFLRLDGDRLPVALVVEFETSPSGDIYPRQGEYALRLHREAPFQRKPGVPYDVVGCIVFLTGPRQSSEWAMRPDDFGGLGMSSTLAVPCFRAMDAALVLEDIAAGRRSRALYPWVLLMGNSASEELARRWLQLVLGEDDARLRKDILAVAGVFLELNDQPEVWRSVLEGADVIRSPFMESLRAEGRAQDAAITRGMLYQTLEQQLGGQTPRDVRERVEQETDFTTLLKWYGNAHICPDWQAVRTMLGLASS